MCRLIPPGGLATQPRNSAPDAMGVVWAVVPAPRNSVCIGYSGRSRLRAPLVSVLANRDPAFRLPSFDTSQIAQAGSGEDRTGLAECPENHSDHGITGAAGGTEAAHLQDGVTRVRDEVGVWT